MSKKIVLRGRDFNKYLRDRGIAPMSKWEWLDMITGLLELSDQELRKMMVSADEHGIAFKTMAQWLLDPDNRLEAVREISQWAFRSASKDIDNQITVNKQLRLPDMIQQQINQLLLQHYGFDTEYTEIESKYLTERGWTDSVEDITPE